MEAGDRSPSFACWLSALLLGSFVAPLLLPLFPVVPAAGASQLSDITASAARLDQLFSAEREVVARLQEFVRASETGLERAKRYLEKYRNEDPGERPSNPVRDFRLLQRVEEHWNEELAPEQLIRTLETISDTVRRFVGDDGGPPGKREAIETITALVMVQLMYNVDVTELAEGRLLGLETGTKMSTYDVKKMAEVAFTSRLYKSGLVWMEAAVEIARKRNESEMTISTRTALENYKREHDRLLATGVQGYKLFSSPAMGRSPAALLNEAGEQAKHSANPFDRVDPLCRGEDLRNPTEIAKLVCSYAKPAPYFVIQPLKKEEHYSNPYICEYHDFLRQDEMDTIIEVATPQMKRSTVGADKQATIARVSSSARLEDDYYPLVSAIGRKIELVTGLETRNRTGYLQETLKICEYGTGGFFTPHHDFLRLEDPEVFRQYVDNDPMQEEMGERTATVMIYLNSVLRGGRTVFPVLGLSIEPRPGSAIFWENLLPDGTGDERMLHSGCPVAFGYKWIATKFVRSVAQTFRRPCRKVDAHGN